MRGKNAASMLAAVLVLTAAGSVQAEKLRPFSPVVDVCPTCTTGPQYDRIVLRDGTSVIARVVAENDAFLVLEKFAELRAVGRDQVDHVERNVKVERPATYGDQVLVTSGIVLAGTIKSPQGAFDPIVITVAGGNVDHSIWRIAIQSAFRGGTLVLGVK